MFVIGLTGGIGAGKTLVSETLEALGATLINADLVGHQAYLPNTDTWRAVVDAFGREILDEDDQIIRRALGAIVFSDPDKLALLNSIVHPRIYAMIRERIDALAQDGVEIVVVEAALLIEANWTPLADEIWVVAAPRELTLERLAARGMSEERARTIMDAQMPQDERLTHADVVITNDGGVRELEAAVEDEWQARIAPIIGAEA